MHSTNCSTCAGTATEITHTSTMQHPPLCLQWSHQVATEQSCCMCINALVNVECNIHLRCTVQHCSILKKGTLGSAHTFMQATHFPCKPILKHQANADWACNWVRPGYSESQSDPRLLFAFANCVHAKRNLTHTRIMCYNAQPCSISLAWLNHACTNTCNAKPCFRNEHLTTRHIAIRRASASV